MESDITENRSRSLFKHIKHFSVGNYSLQQTISLKRSSSYGDIPRNNAEETKDNIQNKKADIEAKSCKLIFMKSIQKSNLSSSTLKVTIFVLMSILVLSNVDPDDYNTHPKHACEVTVCGRKTVQEAINLSILDISPKSSKMEFAQTDICVYPVSLTCYFEHMVNGTCTNSEDYMSNEMLRLYSLRNFPRNINISLIHLARSGFYHTDQPGETRCYSCRVTYRSWTSRDNPMNVHRRISPTCELVTQNQCRRTHDDELSAAYERLSIVSSNDIASDRHVSSARGVLEISRPSDHGNQNLSSGLRTQNHTATHDVNNNDHRPSGRAAEGGGNQLSESRVASTNDTCNTSVDSEVDSANNSLSIAVPTLTARFPHFRSLQVRISSFQGWPSYLNQTAREMALAGFLYAGCNNYTRCFFCGGGLRNWEAGDDPWVEHARWFPQCEYVRENKGERFVNAVLKKQKEMDASKNNNFNTLQNKPQSMAASGSSITSPTNDQSNHDVLETIAAISVLEMGYTDQQVLEAFEILKSSSSDPFHLSQVTVMDILNVLFNKDNKQSSLSSNGETSGNELQGMATSDNIDTELILEENRQLKDQRLCKVCLELNATIAFLPCGHITCCTDCAPAMRKCPICRAYVKGTVKTYLA